MGDDGGAARCFCRGVMHTGGAWCAAHWNPTVESLARNVMKHFTDMHGELYEECLANYKKEADAKTEHEERRRRQWEAVVKAAGT